MECRECGSNGGARVVVGAVVKKTLGRDGDWKGERGFDKARTRGGGYSDDGRSIGQQQEKGTCRAEIKCEGEKTQMADRERG